MDVKLINPFLESFLHVMPQLGFQSVQKKGISVKGRDIKSSGVIIILGLVGDVKGNIVYNMDIESAKQIASKMMMGMPVDELNDLAQSAISELSNMLTANASINLSNIGVTIDISTPTLMHGHDFQTKMNTEQVLCIEIDVDGITIEANISIGNG